jgi:uncharacterized protein (DUF952 family)
VIYKLLPAAEWSGAVARGSYPGSAVDRRDGFIHFSAAGQVVQTAALYFGGQAGLVLLTVDPDLLGELRWEVSRGGARFPHLYGELPVTAVVAADPLPDDGPAAEAVAALLAGVRPVRPGSRSELRPGQIN